MGTPKYLGLIALLVAGVAFAGPRGRDSTQELGPQLRFSAVPVSASFKQGEKVMYEFKIQNRGRSALLVSPLFILNYDIHLKVSDTQGREVSWCGVIAKYVFPESQFVTLQPGRTIRVQREISCDRLHESGFSIVALGNHTVTATYHFPIPKEMRDHTGAIPFASGDYVSEPSRFAIVPKQASAER